MKPTIITLVAVLLVAAGMAPLASGQDPPADPSNQVESWNTWAEASLLWLEDTGVNYPPEVQAWIESEGDDAVSLAIEGVVPYLEQLLVFLVDNGIEGVVENAVFWYCKLYPHGPSLLECPGAATLPLPPYPNSVDLPPRPDAPPCMGDCNPSGGGTMQHLIRMIQDAAQVRSIAMACALDTCIPSNASGGPSIFCAPSGPLDWPVGIRGSITIPVGIQGAIPHGRTLGYVYFGATFCLDSDDSVREEYVLAVYRESNGQPGLQRSSDQHICEFGVGNGSLGPHQPSVNCL